MSPSSFLKMGPCRYQPVFSVSPSSPSALLFKPRPSFLDPPEHQQQRPTPLPSHPSINSLTLNDLSVTYTDIVPLPANCLTHLQDLIAPPRHILNILRDSQSAGGPGQWQDISYVGFSPESPSVLGWFGDRISDPAARYEPFDADEFDAALAVVADLDPKLNNDLALAIQIPGRARSAAWFVRITGAQDQRAERRMQRVTQVSVRTECNVPLDGAAARVAWPVPPTGAGDNLQLYSPVTCCEGFLCGEGVSGVSKFTEFEVRPCLRPLRLTDIYGP